MKKILPVFLCALLLFNNFSLPARAAHIEINDVSEASVYSVAPASAAAGVLTLTSTGGAMGVGTGLISSAALPVLGYILAAGVIVYSVTQLADCVMEIYQSLSSEALTELDLIESSGVDNVILSEYENLAAELPTALESAQLNGSLSFRAPVDVSMFEVFDRSITPLQGSGTLSTGIYSVPLTAEPAAIPGTSLMVSMIEAPFSGFIEGAPVSYAWKFENTLTGVIMYYSYYNHAMQEDYYNYHFAGPRIWKGTDGGIHHYYLPFTYTPFSTGNTYSYAAFEDFGGTVSKPLYITFEGTGNPSLDNILFFSSGYNGVEAGTWYLEPLATLHPGLERVELPCPPFSIVASPGYANIGLTDSPAIPEEDTPIYLPPSIALDNANTLTQTGALTGTWDTTIDGEKVDTDSPAIDGETGFLANFWDTFVQKLQAALIELFVPSDGFFEQFISNISSTFEDRMGILTYPISVVVDFCNHLLDIGVEEPVFKWSSWAYEGTTFLPAGEFNFNDILENETFKGIHDLYLLIVDAGIVWGLLKLAQRKYDAIIAN